MTKLVTFLAFIAFGCMLAFSPANQTPQVLDRDFDETLHTKCIYPTIRISSDDMLQKSSGFIVRSEKVVTKIGIEYHNVSLTCSHCVANEDSVYHADIPIYDKSYFKNWVRFPGAVYASSPTLDLAIFVFTTPTQMPVVEMDFARSLCIGNKVFHVGCGLGEDPRYDDGYINSLNVKLGKHPTEVYRTSVLSVFGDSGGPAFYGKNYKVIGMMQAIRVTMFHDTRQMIPGISMCIPIGTLKTWNELENNTLRFIYNFEAGLPRLPYAMLGFRPLDWENIAHEED